MPNSRMSFWEPHATNSIMSSNQQPPADKQWNTALYDSKASFVWKYGCGVVELLAPRPGERILDLGCGTGHLTNLIAQAGAEVIGLDKSESMIAQARSLFPRLRFELGDGADFHFDQSFDAVFSNAAIHWMLDQTAVARRIWQALKPGGRFVAEFGGKGNVEAIRAALREAIEVAGERVGLEPFARYYPSIAEHAALLEAQGFRVTFASHFDRPTQLDDGGAGLRNWLFTFADNVVESLPAGKRDQIIAAVEDGLRSRLFRDGSWYADYRRIRIAATKERPSDS